MKCSLDALRKWGAADPRCGQRSSIWRYLVVVIFLWGSVRAEDVLTPAQDQMLQKFVERAAASRQKVLLEEMEKMHEAVEKAAGTEAELRQRVEEAKGKAVDHAMTDWRAGFSKMCRDFLISASDSATAMMAESAKVETVVQGYRSNQEGKGLEALAVWTEALKAVLNEDQLKKWQGAKSGLDEERQRKLAKFLQPYLNQVRQQATGMAENELPEIQTALHLDQARVKKLRDALDKIGQDAEAEWTEKQNKAFKNIPDADLDKDPQQSKMQMMLEVATEMAFAPKRKEWESALEKELTKEELEHWTKGKGGRKKRFEQGLCDLTIAELDKEVYLTNEQREKLEAPVASVLLEQPWFRSEDRMGRFYLSRAMLLGTGSGLKEAQLKLILDATQLERWKDTVTRANEEPWTGLRPVKHAKDKDGNKMPGWTLHREKLIADHLDRSAEQYRTHLAQSMKQEINFVMRVSAPAAEMKQRLELAAKGAVERSLDPQMHAYSSWLESSVNDTQVEALEAHLETLTGYRTHFHPQEEGVWSHALDATLTPAQRSVLDKEFAVRDDYFNKSLAATLLIEVDQKCGLSDEQFTQLQPLLAHSLAEYGQDISNWYEGDWYLNSPYRILPMLGIPDEELKRILTPEQTKLFQEEVTNYESWWRQITRNHQSRVQGSKKS